MSGIICIFTQDGLCVDKLSIKNVGVEQKVFSPDHGQKAVILFEITKPADVCVTIYDLLGRPVWSHRAFIPAGKNKVEWPGVDNNKKPACGDVFLYVITASADHVITTYNPAKETGGILTKTGVFNFDSKTGEVEYVLPNACMAQMLAMLKNGMLVKTVFDWQPQAAGRHNLHLDSTDKFGLIKLINNPEIELLLTSYTLPDNAIIASGLNGLLNEKRYPFIIDANDVWGRENKCPYYWRDPRLRNEPKFTVSFLGNVQNDKRGTPIISKSVTVRVTADDSERNWLIDKRFEILFYIDGTYFFDIEDGTIPSTFDWDTSMLTKGPHVFTVNFASYDNLVGVVSRKVIIGG
jgi:hypothetical protein